MKNNSEGLRMKTGAFNLYQCVFDMWQDALRVDMNVRLAKEYIKAEKSIDEPKYSICGSQ